MAKSMLLVPETEFHRLQEQCGRYTSGAGSTDILAEVKRPVERELVKTYDNIEHTFKDPSISSQEKVAKHVESMNDFTTLRDRITGPVGQQQQKQQQWQQLSNGDNATTVDDDVTMNDAIEMMPLTLQKPARQLLQRLSRRKDLISWDKNGEVKINGKQLAGSNIGDLVGDVLRARKAETPLRENFLTVLSQANVPDEFIRNKAALARYREIKGGEARKQQRPPGIPWTRESDMNDQDEEAMRLARTVLKAKKKKRAVKKAKHGIKWKSL